MGESVKSRALTVKTISLKAVKILLYSGDARRRERERVGGGIGEERYRVRRGDGGIRKAKRREKERKEKVREGWEKERRGEER